MKLSSNYPPLFLLMSAYQHGGVMATEDQKEPTVVTLNHAGQILETSGENVLAYKPHTSNDPVDDTINTLFQVGSGKLTTIDTAAPADTASNTPNDSENDDGDGDDKAADAKLDIKLTDGVLIFETNGAATTNISIGDGMDEISAYFGVDNTDPEELENFVDSFGKCEFCDSGDIDVDSQFARIDCSDWLMFSLFSKKEECAILRAAAVEKCGCKPTNLPAVTEDTPRCNLCPDGSEDHINMDVYLPTMSNELTCRDITQIPAVEGDKTCNAVAGFGHICGCVGADSQCHICPDGSPLTRPNAVLEKGYYAADAAYIQSGGLDLTCSGVEEMLADNTKSACFTSRKDFEKELGISIAPFCGCPNALPPVDGGCEACPAGFQLSSILSNTMIDSLHMTCSEWATEAAHLLISDHEVCYSRQRKVKEHCCMKKAAAEGPLEGEVKSVIVGHFLSSNTESAASLSPSSQALMSLLLVVPAAIGLICN